MSAMFSLPSEILSKIYEFDGTYRAKYDDVVNQIKQRKPFNHEVCHQDDEFWVTTYSLRFLTKEVTIEEYALEEDDWDTSDDDEYAYIDGVHIDDIVHQQMEEAYDNWMYTQLGLQ